MSWFIIKFSRYIRQLSNAREEDFATLRETMWTILEAATKLKGSFLTFAILLGNYERFRWSLKFKFHVFFSTIQKIPESRKMQMLKTNPKKLAQKPKIFNLLWSQAQKLGSQVRSDYSFWLTSNICYWLWINVNPHLNRSVDRNSLSSQWPGEMVVNISQFVVVCLHVLQILAMKTMIISKMMTTCFHV